MSFSDIVLHPSLEIFSHVDKTLLDWQHGRYSHVIKFPTTFNFDGKHMSQAIKNNEIYAIYIHFVAVLHKP